MSRAQAFVAALLLCWTFAAAAEVAVPPLTGRVVDLTGTLSAADIATQSQRLKDLQARKGSQVAVLMVPTTQPETIEQYSLRVAETWKVGRRKIDDGALLVIAKDDHKLRIEVGYGLEGALTDVTARRIIDEVIAPRFKSGDFAGGIAAGITRIIGVIDGEPLPQPAPEASHGQDVDLIGFLNPLNPFTIFIVFVVGTIMRQTLGRLFGAVAAGGAMAAFAWFVAGSIAVSVGLGALVSAFTFFADGIFSANQAAVRRSARGGGGNGWSGGGGGGWSGGSSSSDGGFSGGGGSFGGGGASGSW
jgi:uncharacterized protein